MAFYQFNGAYRVTYPAYEITVSPGDVVNFGAVIPPGDGQWSANPGPATSAAAPVGQTVGPVVLAPTDGQVLTWSAASGAYVPAAARSTAVTAVAVPAVVAASAQLAVGYNDVTLSAASCALAMPAAVAGALTTVTVIVRQDATGGRTITVPPSVSWSGHAAPTLTVRPTGYDVLRFTSIDGVHFIGELIALDVADSAIPGAPVYPSATGGTTGVTVGWVAPFSYPPLTAYQILRATSSAGAYSQVGTTTPGVLTFLDTTTVSGATYFYKVAAVNAVGVGAASTVVSGASTTPVVLKLVTASTDYASTPDGAPGPYAVGTGITKNDFRLKINPTTWRPTALAGLMSKWASPGEFLWFLNTDGTLGFYQSHSATVQGPYMSTAAIPSTTTGDLWVRAVADWQNGALAYFTSPDGATWTQLGTTITIPAATYPDNNSLPLRIGALSGSNGIVGQVKAAQVWYNTQTTASIAVDFTTFTAGATTGTGSTGETWTLGGGASIG